MTKIRLSILLLFLPLALAFEQQQKAKERPALCVLENERSAIYLTMPENMPKGSILTNLPIAGISSGQKANIRLSLVQGRDFVRLNAASKQLALKKDIDREQGLSRIEAIVQCTPVPNQSVDVGYFPLNISVIIAITDVNDNAPKFPQGGKFSINLPEELLPGTPIRLEFAATDRDQPGPNSQIRYRILHQQKDVAITDMETGEVEIDYSSLLDIPDPYKAELFVAGRIDYESVRTFTVPIEAEDQGIPRLSSMAHLVVNLLDTDDLNPVFSSQIYRSNGVERSSHLVIEPGPIRAWDADIGFNETIVFELAGEHSINYAIDELTGAVRLLADQIVPCQLLVHAKQLNRPERNATAFLLIQSNFTATRVAKTHDEIGTDVKPQQFYILKIPSNLAVATELLQLNSLAVPMQNGTTRRRRPDDGKVDKIKFELVGQKDNQFPLVYIDGLTKTLRLARKMAPGEFDVEILAKPLAGVVTTFASNQHIHLRLIVFEPAEWARQLPKFEQAKYEFQIARSEFIKSEDIGTQTETEVPAEDEGNKKVPEEFIRIGQIRAKSANVENAHENGQKRRHEDKDTIESGRSINSSGEEQHDLAADEDADWAPNGGLMFGLMNGEEHFDIEPQSGILRLRNPLYPNSTTLSTSSSLPLPTFNQLFVLVEDAEGRRNFVECIVHIKNGDTEDEADMETTADFAGFPSIHFFLGAVIFLLLLTNSATLSLWLGRRKFANLYDTLSYRYDSMEAKKFGGGPFDGGGKSKNKSGNNYNNNCWMLNHSLEGDTSVNITKMLPIPNNGNWNGRTNTNGRDFFSISNTNTSFLYPTQQPQQPQQPKEPQLPKSDKN